MTDDPATVWILANSQTPVLQAFPTEDEAQSLRSRLLQSPHRTAGTDPFTILRATITHEPTSHDKRRTAPIPLRVETHDQDEDWRAEGERDFDLSIITGQTGDDDPEQWIARNEREELRDQLADLDADQLRNYIDGLHTGMEMFFFRGL